MAERERSRCILLDWGNTLMRDFPQYPGPMHKWPRVAVLPHVAETLAALHPDWTLAVATNAGSSDEAIIRKALARGEIDHLIDRVYCFRKIGFRKPEPGFYAFILQDLGLPAERVVMVGDHFIADVLGANTCGIRAVWFNEFRQETPSGELYRTIRSFDELPGALEDLAPG